MTRKHARTPADRARPERAERLKSALKANMARRKEQARARAQAKTEQEAPGQGDGEIRNEDKT